MKYATLSVLLLAAIAAGQWLETTLDVGGLSGLCYNPQSNKVYCAQRASGSVAIIDGATNLRIGRVTGTGEARLCYNPTGNVVYCADYWGRVLTVIDGVTDTVVARRQVSGSAGSLCHAPSESVLFCAFYLGGAVAVVDGVSHSEICTLATGAGPDAMCFDPHEGRLYCANSWDSTITVIRRDRGLWLVETTLAVGTNPGPLCYDSADGKAYCGTADRGVAVIRRDNSVGYVATGRHSAPACYDPRAGMLYCTDEESSVTVIDCTSDSVIAAVRVGLQPKVAYFNSLNNKVYCADCGSHDVTVIDAATNAVLVTIAVDSHPCAFAWNPIQNRTYVGCEGGSGGRIDVIRDSIPSGVQESGQPTAYSSQPTATILTAAGLRRLALGVMYDAMGRRALDPKTGVYFVREPSAASCRKVILQR